MKIIVSGNELKNKIKEAVDIMCNTVKATLGPNGSNAIIDHFSFSPFITNDGVTIASNIESEDECINTILTLVKEASIKTNDIVGDGTTTTLVLLQAIYTLGLKKIDNGVNPIILKQELDLSVNNIISEIKKCSRKCKLKDIKNIASISSNSKYIGNKIMEAYKHVKNVNAIKIIENNTKETRVIYKVGYSIDTNLASPYFLLEKEITLNNAYVLTTNIELLNIDDIANIINEIVKLNSSLVILAEDYSDEFVNNILSLYINNKLNIILLKNPEFGKNKIDALNDISFITNSKIIDNISDIKISNMGICNEIKIDNNSSTFIGKNKSISNRLKALKDQRKDVCEKYELEFLDKRIAMLENGIAYISVGAITDIERRELKMRYDDALCSISSLENGIVPGSGLIFYKISNDMMINNNGDEIFKEALKYPIKQILYNAGLNLNILKEIENSNCSKIYNINTDLFENNNETKILDPVDVLINSLANASSIAGMLLTTNSLIINEQSEDKKITIQNDIY